MFWTLCGSTVVLVNPQRRLPLLYQNYVPLLNFAILVKHWAICCETVWFVVFGDNVIQKRLLVKDPLTLVKAMELAQGMEVAAKNAATLNPNPGVTEVHRPNTTPTPT